MRYHFFTSSALNWNVGTDLLAVCDRQRSLDGTDANEFACFVVPLPIDATYPIERHAPQVDGARLLFIHTYNGATELADELQPDN